jgi:ABC-2 type transport system permease protein
MLAVEKRRSTVHGYWRMRYLRLWFSFLKMSAMADFEYRANIVLRVITEVVWYTMQLSVFEVLYTHTDSISGWTVQDMRVFMGTLFITDVTYMILFHENMDQIWSMVRKGDLDLYLVKPVNSQFMVSCRKVSVAYVFNWILVLAYLVWAVHAMDRPVGAWQILTFTVLAIFGVILCYVLRFMFSIIRSSCVTSFLRFFRWLSLPVFRPGYWLKESTGHS